MAVGPGETVDAARVLGALDLVHREHLREGLAAALLRRSGQRQAFDTLFDLYWPAALGAGAARWTCPASTTPTTVRSTSTPCATSSPSCSATATPRHWRSSPAPSSTRWAGRAGSGSGIRGLAGQPTWSAYQSLRMLSPETLLARILADLRGPDVEEGSFADEVLRREIRDRIAAFRKMVTDEVRRRTAELRGRDQVARTAVPKQIEQVEFLSAHAEQLAELRRTVQPLARRLASRLAVRRKRAKRGEIDMRRTLRRSMSTGGVPMRPAYRTRRPGRPELVMLCDVSGSVAGFSHFTMLLVQALREQFSKVRVFAFVERADEVTAPVRARRGARRRACSACCGRPTSSRSTGTATTAAASAASPSTGAARSPPKTSLLMLGDGRTNYRDPNLAVLRRLVGAARHAHWLNPEPRRSGAAATPRRCATPRSSRCTSAARPRSSRPSWRRCCPSDLRRGRDAGDFEEY